MSGIRPMFSPVVLRAAVPPLASIFGSGFLIIVPVLERTTGALSVVGIAGVCALAWLVGTVIRHNVSNVEAPRERGELGRTVRFSEDASDLVIAVAYVISVALYLRIMSQYVVEFAGSESFLAERALASAALGAIVAVGVARGFTGLDVLERVALGAVIVLTTVLGGALFLHDGGQLLSGTLELPPVPSHGVGHVLLVLGGLVITVQGFETVRYLADEYDRRTRILASRLAQLVSASVYIGFVAVATPEMGLASGSPDQTLLDITDRLLPLLSVAVVVTAVLSQFSAAVADTVAADGNMRLMFPKALRAPRPFALSGAAAALLIWLIPTFTLIVIASRAFAAYYALQCVSAFRTTERAPARAGFAALGVVLLAIALLAQPAD